MSMETILQPLARSMFILSYLVFCHYISVHSINKYIKEG